MIIYTQELVRDYVTNGFSPIPVEFKTKRPINKQWTKLRVTMDTLENYFDETPTNIGILTGQPSGGLVDVDIDDIDALKFAPRFLPETNCVFGHESKPSSHWLYRVPDCRMQEQFTANGMILEIRGNNRCTVFPGSVHPSGERVEFESRNGYASSASTWKKLKRAGSKIAIATLLYKSWSPGSRHELTLSTAAMLARLGWSVTEVHDLVTAIATEANDEELSDRLASVESTFAEYAQGRPISGNERLSQLVGPEGSENIRRWACSPEALKTIRSLSPSPIANPISTALADLSSDAGAADAFATAFKDQLIYSNKEWFQRKNDVFEPVTAEMVQGLAKDFLQQQLGNLSPGTAILSPLKSCLARSRINAAVELSRSKFIVEQDDIDDNIYALGCSDGSILDLGMGTSLPAAPRILLPKS
jgi:hypothetical protein